LEGKIKTVVITGANRGIGLAPVKQFINQGYNVFAVCRQPSVALMKLTVNVLEGIDVTIDILY